MRRHIISLVLIVLATEILMGKKVSDCAHVNGDTTEMCARKVLLQARRDSLRIAIKEQDKLRNRHIPGVSLTRMEEINDNQDSICLSLRSALVDVLLEIKEKASVPMPSALLKYNRLIEGKDSTRGRNGHDPVTVIIQ